MNTQTIGGGEAVVTNGQNGSSQQGGGQAPRPGSTDALVDAALDALSDTGPVNDNASEEVRRDRKGKRAPDPRDEGEGGDVVEEAPEGQQEQTETQAADEGAQEDESEEAHDTRGSESDPFTVKDLESLKGKFIELKVDGQKVKVELTDLPNGWIRNETFNRWANKTKMMASEAQTLIQQATEARDRVKKELGTFLYDPNEVFDFYMQDERREKVLEAAARRYAELRKFHRERPEERLAFQRRRDEERLAAERSRWERERDAEVAERKKQEQFARARAILQPGWEAGMRKAGFPEPTQALRDEVLLRCQQKESRGEELTSDDVADFVVRAARLLELPPRGGKKKPGPAPAPSAPRREAAPRSDKWNALPQHKKVKDVDFYLRGLKTRDFR